MLAAVVAVLQGKQQAEAELFRSYPNAGVALRPWIIYGDRALRCVDTVMLRRGVYKQVLRRSGLQH
jgi:hypothetical protein